VDLYEETHDYFSVAYITDEYQTEVDFWECTFAWTIGEVWWWDPTNEEWVDVTDDNGNSYLATINDDDQQSCDLEVELYEEGYWFFAVDVDVTWPD
jgi:hypothetical protein